MSISKRPTLWVIREAVMKNTCRPTGGEFVPVDAKPMRISSSREGDSQLGLTIFVGLAIYHGYDIDDISLAEGIEHKEVYSKIKKYNQKIKSTDKKFTNKASLIKNYIRLHG